MNKPITYLNLNFIQIQLNCVYCIYPNEQHATQGQSLSEILNSDFSFT